MNWDRDDFYRAIEPTMGRDSRTAGRKMANFEDQKPFARSWRNKPYAISFEDVSGKKVQLYFETTGELLFYGTGVRRVWPCHKANLF